MRGVHFSHPDGADVLLSYCTNVHPAQDVAGVVAQLDRYAAPIRRRLGWPRLGLGLWLPASAAAVLAADPVALAAFGRELSTRDLFVVTVNGFPYGDFHGERVKKLVYRPDWSDPRRLAYTLDLARILAALLPGDVTEGTISTLPLGWREGWSEEHHTVALGHLSDLARELRHLRRQTGRNIRVGLEPEPGCVIETCDDLIRAGLPAEIGDHVGLCLDTCHLAVGFSDAGRFLKAAAEAGLSVVKVQAACALEADRPADGPAHEALRSLAEPRYLHQVRRRRPDGGLDGVDDLPDAARTLAADEPWRVHFHAPVHRTHVGALRTTQPELADALAGLFGGPHPATRHLEVETYTWDVLPGAGGEADLVAGIAGELSWTAGRLTSLGLKGETQT